MECVAIFVYYFLTSTPEDLKGTARWLKICFKFPILPFSKYEYNYYDNQ
jgi:hypothetical protein